MQNVKVWGEKVAILTYKVGQPNKNPMFLEKRVYQGSSGVVYPYPVIDKVFDEKEEKEYVALFLENEYLKVMILPELGGRIQMAYDKTNDYHFIYYNHVIKPALVGLTGPWISGGIEFNWPQHHRPSTFNPVDYTIEENDDGSKTVWVNETEIMFHTKGMAGITLYPDCAYLEITGKLYNRTLFPQTFLWWANPAVQVDDKYRLVFPPDVNAVYDHGKRDVSSFPIATGTYYKVDYAPGTDISRYTNIPVPTSYMAVDSDFDFVGGYDQGKNAGILHVADHHISPGKKLWTWGAGDFGRRWDRHLTDPDKKGEYPPYIEIMTGVYTDNQPDFSWLMPNEKRQFKQYFLPYKDVGYVKNANKEAAVNLEIMDQPSDRKGKKIIVQVYVTSKQKDVHIILKNKSNVLFDETADLSPASSFKKEIIGKNVVKDQISLDVIDQEGRKLVDYKPVVREEEAIPKPARAIGMPARIKTNEELYLAGLHLEQYRHATFSAVRYYKEALSRDSSDVRCNNALGLWYLKHGQFTKAEPYFHKAIDKLIRHNPNPYDGEPYYNLGLCLSYLERWDEAYEAFYKACWNAAWQDNAYLQLAYIDCRKEDWNKALKHVEHALSRNYHGMKARHLKAILLRKTDKIKDAEKWIEETLSIDLFDFGSINEKVKLLACKKQKEQAEREEKELWTLMRDWEQSYIEIAIDYACAGLYKEAVSWLLGIKHSSYPMVHYYLACYFSKIGRVKDKEEALRQGAQLSPDRVFPNRLEDILVLQWVIKENKTDYKAAYYLGNLWYDKRQYEEAIQCWEQSVSVYDKFPTAHRNLGIAYYNKLNAPDRALLAYEKAFDSDPGDARILFELDQLYKRNNRPVEERLAFLEKHSSIVRERDDLYIEYVTLHNLLGNYDTALQLLEGRNFHPWEGGEGKVIKQYVYTKKALAKKALEEGSYDVAIQLLEEAQVYPENLGEGKLYVAQENDIFYALGCVYEAKGQTSQAREYWESATEGTNEPTQALYYNDQDPAMIFYQGLAWLKLGREKKAKEHFENLIDYGKIHLNKKAEMDFFAVSLPDLSVFEPDIEKRNKEHCHYLMGLGYLGMKNIPQAEKHFKEVLKMNTSFQGIVLRLLGLSMDGYGFFRRMNE